MTHIKTKNIFYLTLFIAASLFTWDKIQEYHEKNEHDKRFIFEKKYLPSNM